MNQEDSYLQKKLYTKKNAFCFEDFFGVSGTVMNWNNAKENGLFPKFSSGYRNYNTVFAILTGIVCFDVAITDRIIFRFYSFIVSDWIVIQNLC